MNRIPGVLLLMLLSMQLHAQPGNYDRGGSVPILSSKQTLRMDTVATRLQGNEQLAAVLAGAVPPLLDLGSTLIQTSLKNAAARYESQFTVTASASGFWISEKEVRLPVLVITREVLLRKEQEKGMQPAMRIILRPELSMDRTAFRFVLDSGVLYRYSGARTRGSYDYINLDLLISLQSLTITEGQPKLVTLRSTLLSIPALKPGEGLQQVTATGAPGSGNVICSGWIPFPPPPSFGALSETAEEVVRTVATHGTNNGKPDNDTLTTSTRTIARNQPVVQQLYRNGGLYEFEVSVTETNPYKVKAAVRNELISRSADPTAELLKAILEK